MIERVEGKIRKGERTIFEGEVWVEVETDQAGWKKWRCGYSPTSISSPELETGCCLELKDGRSGECYMKKLEPFGSPPTVTFTGTGPLESRG